MAIDNLIEQAKQAQKDKDWSESFKLWQQVRASAPSREATFGIALALENLQELEKSYDLYLRLIDKNPKSVRFRHGLGRVCMSLENYELAKEQWEALTTLKPELPKWTIQLAKCLLELKRYEQLLSILEEATKQWPDNKLIQHLHKKNSYLYSGDPSGIEASKIDPNSPQTSYEDGFRRIRSQRHELDAQEYLKRLETFSSRWKDKSPPKLLLANIHMKSGRFTQALGIYYELEHIWDDRLLIQYSILQCLIALDEMEQAQDRLCDYIHGEILGLELEQKMTWLLSLPGNRDRAEALLVQINRFLASHPSASDMNRPPMTLGKLYSGRAPKRPLITDWDLGSEINISPRGPGEDVFILFTGYAKKMGGAPVSSIDRLLAGYGASLILLKDHSGLLYQRGVPEVAPDFESTIAELKKIISELGARRVFTIGSSGGCFGALRYGLELKAHNIMLFSGPTNLDVEFLSQHGDYRARATIRKLNREFSAEELNLGQMLGRTVYESSIDAYYSAENQYDAAQALHIAEFPNVHLHPLEDSDGHDTIGMAFTNGVLSSHIESLLGTPPESDNAAGTLKKHG